MKLLTSIKPWTPDRAAVFLWRTGNECQESCCFRKVVLETRRKKQQQQNKTKQEKNLAGLRTFMKHLLRKIKSVHITERLTKKPPNPNKSLHFSSLVEGLKDILFKPSQSQRP